MSAKKEKAYGVTAKRVCYVYAQKELRRHRASTREQALCCAAHKTAAERQRVRRCDAMLRAMNAAHALSHARCQRAQQRDEAIWRVISPTQDGGDAEDAARDMSRPSMQDIYYIPRYNTSCRPNGCKYCKAHVQGMAYQKENASKWEG